MTKIKQFDYQTLNHLNYSSDLVNKMNQIYNLRGKRVMRAETSVSYNNVTFSGENVLMYDDMNCKIVSFGGVEKFTYTFKGQINDIIPVDGKKTFLIMGNSKVQKVKLK